VSKKDRAKTRLNFHLVVPKSKVLLKNVGMEMGIPTMLKLDVSGRKKKTQNCNTINKERYFLEDKERRKG
jgi:hypothetical protein